MQPTFGRGNLDRHILITHTHTHTIWSTWKPTITNTRKSKLDSNLDEYRMSPSQCFDTLAYLKGRICRYIEYSNNHYGKWIFF